MTQIEYIDFIRNSLSMVDKTARFVEPQVGAAINVAVSTVFYELYTQNPKLFKKSLERYTTTSYLVPSLPAQSNRFSTTLTSDVVDLPRKTGGVLEIDGWSAGAPGAINTTTTAFIPVSTMEGEQLHGSESYLPQNVVGFSWNGARGIEFWGNGVDVLAATENGVTIKFIQQFKSYSSTDNVVLPYGQDHRIMELVREYLGVIPPKDLINNNADNG